MPKSVGQNFELRFPEMGTAPVAMTKNAPSWLLGEFPAKFNGMNLVMRYPSLKRTNWNLKDLVDCTKVQSAQLEFINIH